MHAHFSCPLQGQLTGILSLKGLRVPSILASQMEVWQRKSEKDDDADCPRHVVDNSKPVEDHHRACGHNRSGHSCTEGVKFGGGASELARRFASR